MSNSTVHFCLPFSSVTPDSPQDSQSSVGSPLSRVGPQIIGAEDDDFDTEQEQVTFGFSHPYSSLAEFCSSVPKLQVLHDSIYGADLVWGIKN